MNNKEVLVRNILLGWNRQSARTDVEFRKVKELLLSLACRHTSRYDDPLTVTEADIRRSQTAATRRAKNGCDLSPHVCRRVPRGADM